ncbi:hypothetical protein NDU88_004253 [Pleurodeles waltl]|uniref:Uncharacterized protein n=1 Tax=Pleurodeles waltl TaxID=8319 RepID=A0AAV7TQS5_PLEWA|nr:hypothetical protein NDU88_004253 [Pleurodeles waltl]
MESGIVTRNQGYEAPNIKASRPGQREERYEWDEDNRTRINEDDHTKVRGVAKASRWRTHFHSAPDPSVICLESARNPPPSRGHQDLLPRDGRKKSEARVRSRGSGGLTESRPRGAARNIGGLGRGRDPPGQTRGEGPRPPLAHCLLPALLRPPISPTQRTRPRVGTRGGGENGPGRERRRARADLRVCDPRPATKKSRERRRRESPGKKRNPLQQILGGGRIPRLLSCIPPPRPESRGPGPGRGDRPRSRRWIGGKSSIIETTTNRGTGPGGSPL